MTKLISTEEIVNCLEKYGYYINENNYVHKRVKNKINLIDKLGYKYYATFESFTGGKNGLRIVDKANPYSFDNICIWVKNVGKDYHVENGEYISRDIKSIILHCDKCENKWNTCWSHMLEGMCPFCSHKAFSKEISLAYLYPELVEKEWDYEKNLISPFEYPSQSTKRVYWTCSKCGYNWMTSIQNRSKKGSGCPVCCGNLPSETNNLAAMFPEILNEWDYDLNGDPHNYTSASPRKVHWICSVCRNKWMTAIGHRTGIKNTGCPYCNGLKFTKETSLGGLYPDLLLEWDYEKNSIDPFECAPHTSKKYWWICSICGNNWKTQVISRSKFEMGCPNCSSSIGNKKIKKFLLKNNVLILPEHRITDCRNAYALPFDFYLPDYGVLIEYQGKQHYIPVDYFGGQAGFEKTIKNDSIKEQYCLDNNIPLLKIKYTDFNRIPEILTAYLNL